MYRCDEIITIFNSRLDPETGFDVYYRTVITGVSWYSQVASAVTNDGLKAANSFTLRIPTDADFSGKTYVDPKGYTEANPADAFTIQNGDTIVHGEVLDDNLSPAELQKRFSEVTVVLGVTDNRKARYAPHWKVVGK